MTDLVWFLSVVVALLVCVVAYMGWLHWFQLRQIHDIWKEFRRLYGGTQ